MEIDHVQDRMKQFVKRIRIDLDDSVLDGDNINVIVQTENVDRRIEVYLIHLLQFRVHDFAEHETPCNIEF